GALPPGARVQVRERHEQRPDRALHGARDEKAPRVEVLDEIVLVEVAEALERDRLEARAVEASGGAAGRRDARIGELILRGHAVLAGVVVDVDRGPEERRPLNAGQDRNLDRIRRSGGALADDPGALDLGRFGHGCGGEADETDGCGDQCAGANHYGFSSLETDRRARRNFQRPGHSSKSRPRPWEERSRRKTKGLWPSGVRRRGLRVLSRRQFSAPGDSLRRL